MRSLRRLLAVRFTLTMVITLLVIGGAVYLVTQRTLHQQLDQSLASFLDVDLATLTPFRADRNESPTTSLDVFIERVNRFVVRRDWEGAVVAANTPHAITVPFDAGAVVLARAGEVVWRTEHWDDLHLRSVYAPGRSGVGVVHVSASLEPLNAVTRNLLLFVLTAIVLGSAATLFGAMWLSRSAVTPMRDITAQAKAISPGAVGQRITAHADIAEAAGLVTVLNDVLKRLDRMVEAQRRMIENAGHDLRTPITAMRGEMEVALRGQRTQEEYRAVLTSALEELDRLHYISDALATLARIEAGEARLRLLPTDVAGLLESAMRRAATRAGSRQLVFDPPEDVDTSAQVDAGMIELLFNHLLDNAVEHTPDGTSVRAHVDANAEEIRVIVEDDGPGLPADVLPHLFDRFFRGDLARSRSAGAGLGLSVSAAVVAAHRGNIDAGRSQQGGLMVVVTLRRDPALQSVPEGAEGQLAQAAAQHPASARAGRPLT
jgi:signal transduction histidine kinase